MDRRYSPDIALEAKPVPARAPGPAVDLAAVITERIRLRAYEISLVRTGLPDALTDWLQAEEEVLAKQAQSLT